MIAYEQVAKSAPDGYTLGLISTPFALNLSLNPALPYNTQRDFAPISLIASTPNVLVCNPRLPVKSVKDLVALARAKPGTLNYASVGIGSSPHLSAELFKRMAAVDMVHVPYNGSGPALTDLVGGRIDLMFVNLPAALPHVRAGKLTLLAVAGEKRSALVPEAPTMMEAGLAGFVSIGWYGAVTQAGVAPQVVSRYAAEIARIVNLPDVRERVLALGAEARAMTPAEFTAYINEEIGRWGKIVKESGARATN
jgi:tripartite-type tricarboxylate transporter receptor subunit TctC